MMDADYVDIEQRIAEYDKEHCWQYDIRLRNKAEDLAIAGLTEEQVSLLTTKDFEFQLVTDRLEKTRLVDFIKRHEWLGTLAQYTTHWYSATYDGRLAGVILMSIPSAFSKLMGEDTMNIERLISRGACISWSPKNLASEFLMWCVRDMVKNTPFRLFTAYSDPTAKELGTIYQACNFYYLGQSSGAGKRYINPYTGKWVSDRFFRYNRIYKIYAKEMGITWQSDWSARGGKINWHNMPSYIEEQLRQYGRDKMNTCKSISLPSKHKYAYVLGVDKRETKKLRQNFLELNQIYPYPKER